MYQKTIDTLKSIQTISSHIKKLGIILNKTEDTELQKLIQNTVIILQQAHSHSKLKGKSTPGNLYNVNKPQIKELINYCEKFIVLKKPEWQVLAERHGWTPPTED